MSLKQDFLRALSETKIVRQRQSHLLTLSETVLPYVVLGESEVNLGDTVVRRGIVKVAKPQLLLLQQPMEFEGFEYQENPNESGAFVALGRMASFPPGKYSNIATKMELFSGSLQQAEDHYQRKLDQANDSQTGLFTGPVDIWALSLFVYVGQMVAESVSTDIEEIYRRYHQSPWN